MEIIRKRFDKEFINRNNLFYNALLFNARIKGILETLFEIIIKSLDCYIHD